RLPFNPQHFPKVEFFLAFNTAISFMTNTNWQAYSGETTMAYLTQMAALAVQNFLSAATAVAVVAALARGFSRKSSQSIGNFWSDLTKATLYILLPLSFVFALVLVSQGTPQTQKPYATATTLEGQEQVIPLGPVASQIAIKQLGTNGGGFFNANSAHPFENPTPLSNFLEIFAIFLIPGALTWAFGKMIGSTRQGWVLFGAMMVLFCAGLTGALIGEHGFNAVLNVHAPLEGQELRFGATGSALFATATTAASCGAVNCMHESLSPLSHLVTMFNMMVGEVIFGGVGSGLYGMVLYAIMTVFIAGLMVGRTPEYLGKKIDSYEVKMSVIGILGSSVILLILAAIAISVKAGTSSLSVQGCPGLNEIIYAFASVSNNNGSAFGGLNANTPFYNLITAIAMLFGRFTTLLAVLAVAGSLAAKKIKPASEGTFPTDGFLFLTLLIGTVVIVGALNFFPVLSIGPILEHVLMISGKGM
ncbi:MAG: potassium-transporting ATPase subunit KdpA, partial [Chitinivibrionales bacterium]|nr:potassium-transporting ATPase subunit KdpA [Chitinivibrionales bacterium]